MSRDYFVSIISETRTFHHDRLIQASTFAEAQHYTEYWAADMERLTGKKWRAGRPYARGDESTPATMVASTEANIRAQQAAKIAADVWLKNICAINVMGGEWAARQEAKRAAEYRLGTLGLGEDDYHHARELLRFIMGEMDKFPTPR